MATYATSLPSGKTNPQGLLRVFTKVFDGSGVIEAAGLSVSAQVSPDMTVRVSGSQNNDNIVFTTAGGHFIQAWNDANANVTITANATGSGKTDSIVAWVDLGAYSAVNANNPGSLKFSAIRGSSGAPNSGEITAVTGSNPYLVLANVAVANGAASINSGNITDQRGAGARLNGSLLKNQSVDTAQIKDGAVSAAKIGNVVTTGQINVSLNAAQVTSLSSTLRTGSASNGVYHIAGNLDISSLGIPSTAKIISAHFWCVGVGNTNNMGAVTCVIQSLAYNTVSLHCQIAGNDTGFPNQTNSKFQGFVRYIA